MFYVLKVLLRKKQKELKEFDKRYSMNTHIDVLIERKRLLRQIKELKERN